MGRIESSIDMYTLCICVSRSIVSDSLQPHGLLPPKLPCPWTSPGKNTGVGSHSPSPGDPPNM